MYPTQIQRHKIIRILLILFILNQVVNFVFGVPVAVQEKLDGTEDGTATLQRRVNVEGSTNIDQTPPKSDGTETDQSRQLPVGTNLRPRRIPPDLTRLPGSNGGPPPPPPPPPPPTTGPRTPRIRPVRPYGPFLPYRPYSFLPTDPRLPVGPNSPLRPSGLRPSGPVRIVSPTRPYFPLPLYHPSLPFALPSSPPPLRGARLQPSTSLFTGNPSTTGHQLTPQQNSGSDSDVHPLSNQQPPPNQEPHSLPNLEEPLPNAGPHPSTSGEAPIDEVLGMLKIGKIKRTLPAPVQ